MRVSIRVSVVLVAVLLMSSIPVQAHHSLPAFWNQDQTIQITGVVKKVNIINRIHCSSLKSPSPTARRLNGRE